MAMEYLLINASLFCYVLVMCANDDDQTITKDGLTIIVPIGNLNVQQNISPFHCFPTRVYCVTMDTKYLRSTLTCHYMHITEIDSICLLVVSL